MCDYWPGNVFRGGERVNGRVVLDGKCFKNLGVEAFLRSTYNNRGLSSFVIQDTQTFVNRKFCVKLDYFIYEI